VTISPCYSPCVASLARKSTGEAYGSARLVHEEAHPSFPYSA